MQTPAPLHEFALNVTLYLYKGMGLTTQFTLMVTLILPKTQHLFHHVLIYKAQAF